VSVGDANFVVVTAEEMDCVVHGDADTNGKDSNGNTYQVLTRKPQHCTGGNEGKQIGHNGNQADANRAILQCQNQPDDNTRRSKTVRQVADD
jgi:hypothetical protein